MRKATSNGRGTTYPLDGVTLLFRHRDGLGTGGQGNVIFAVLSQKREELVRVITDELSQLGVSGAKLLEDGLQHLGLLLDNLPQLLELSVVSEEVEIAEIATTLAAGGSGSGGSSGGSLVAASAP